MKDPEQHPIVFTKRNAWLGFVSYIIVACIIAWVFVR